MDRPRLILRRFGALSFGLGYFDDGVWIDHTAVADPASNDADRALLDVVHTWVACCAEPPTDGRARTDEPMPALASAAGRQSASS